MALAAEDYTEIYQLYSRFNLSVDLGDVAGYVGVFAEDGFFEVSNLPEGAPAAGRHTGPDQIGAMVTKLTTGLAGHCRHFVSPTSLIITGNETEVTTKGYLYEIRPGTVPAVGFYLTGIFDDVIRKIDGRWRFTQRSVSMDPQPWAGETTDVLLKKFEDLNPDA